LDFFTATFLLFDMSDSFPGFLTPSTTRCRVLSIDITNAMFAMHPPF
jgi:hypothetical protein